MPTKLEKTVSDHDKQLKSHKTLLDRIIKEYDVINRVHQKMVDQTKKLDQTQGSQIDIVKKGIEKTLGEHKALLDRIIKEYDVINAVHQKMVDQTRKLDKDQGSAMDKKTKALETRMAKLEQEFKKQGKKAKGR